MSEQSLPKDASLAAPTLQEVLGRVPALAADIDSMNELIPGVPASAANLAVMLKALHNTSSLFLNSDDAAIFITIEGRKHREIRVRVEGANETWEGFGYARKDRALIALERFPATEDGFFRGLVYAKEALRRLRSEGVCPDCANAPGEFPIKVLCLEGMPKCLGCMARATVQL